MNGVAVSEEEVQVNLREKWPHEALDFTPWLAKHLDLLGEAIGLKLEAVGEEHQVGSFSLDILARVPNQGVLVAIENQLEWTDHGHLGQLLTYAGGCKAGIAIWVADEFQYEHAEALHQLNRWAGTNIKFYGVKVDVLRHVDGTLEPRLQRVVSPDDWDKNETLSWPPPPPPGTEKHRLFFDPLIASVQRSGFARSARQDYSYENRFFPSGFDKDIGYAVHLGSGKGAWVYCSIRTWEGVDISNSLFDMLEEDRGDIESIMGAQGEWHWDKYEKHSFSVIGVSRGGSIDDSPEHLEATRAWMLDILPKFKAAFEERTARLLAELRGQEAEPHLNKS